MHWPHCLDELIKVRSSSFTSYSSFDCRTGTRVNAVQIRLQSHRVEGSGEVPFGGA